MAWVIAIFKWFIKEFAILAPVCDAHSLSFNFCLLGGWQFSLYRRDSMWGPELEGSSWVHLQKTVALATEAS